MALPKQNVNINFSQGMDTKSDPKQVPIGKFRRLVNSVFGTTGLLKKRNGFPQITEIPVDTSTSITTFNGNLLAIGQTVQAFSEDSARWINSGKIQPIELEVKPMVRSSSSQRTVDTAVSSNNLACNVWLDSDATCYYQIVESETGQIVVSYHALPATAAFPRVFNLGRYFIITFLATVSAATHLRYIAIPINNPTNPSSAADLSSVVSALTAGYDGYVANNSLYVAYDANDMGGAVRVTYIDSSLNIHNTIAIAGHISELMSVTADTSQSTPVIWITSWDSGTTDAYSTALTGQLIEILAPTKTISSTSLKCLTSAAVSGVLRLFAEVNNTYSYSPNAVTDYIQTVTCTEAGVVGSPSIILRGVGLFSKAFYFPQTSLMYMLASYGQAYQPTYFLIDQNGNVIAKLAYSNGAGYVINQVLPGVNINGEFIQIGYLIKDLLVSVNKSQGVTNVAGTYSQTGINLVTFDFNNNSNTQEIGNNLNLTGGFLWAYDGVKPVEQGFHVWPEDITATGSTSGGSMSNQSYFYQITYEWTDAQGNLFRSAPSIPTAATVASGSSGSVVLKIPTLRLTYKITPNRVRIVIYRWSTAQQSYYQVTSITSPTMNNPSVDSISYTDTLADSSILGNVLLYTTGGVVENVAAPALIDVSLFKNRLLGISAEDRNLVWYSKQVIEGTPVEMSDLFTFFVAPTTGAQGSTGDLVCASSMDDKAILFKDNAIYYFTGNGPDNTGANNDFSEPIFITSTVGCNNKKSIVFIPQGLMFESDKGIWLLTRDLGTQYIGADVEEFNGDTIKSAVNVPGTTQVRFTLTSGTVLMYDYFYNQWGVFEGIEATSSTLYTGLHTYLNRFGQVFRELPNTYFDGSRPTLMSFTTGWINLAGLQGYERAYFFYLLGEFLSPHKIQLEIAYDYAPYPSQSLIITPENYNAPYGGDEVYGQSTPYGGSPTLEQWRIFFQQQRCQAFQITFKEIFDSSYTTSNNNKGLTVSGLNLVFGIKKGWKTIMSKNTAG